MSDTQQTAPAAPEEWAAEQRRRYLLAQMGLQPLVSRFDAPGARVAERRLWEAPAPVAPTPTPATAPQPSRPAAPRIDVETPAPARRPDRQAEPSHPAPPQPVAAGAQFSLLICAAAGYLWVENLPERVLASAQLNLTRAMAQAIGGPDADLVYRQFDWPIVENKALPTDLASAQQSLAALLGRMRSEQGAAGLIQMGECEVLPDLGDTRIHRIPATLAMLETPPLKAEAWAVLKPLRPRG